MQIRNIEQNNFWEGDCMRIFTERENKLFKLIESYMVTQADLSSKITESAPPEIKKAFEEFLRIGKEEDAKYAALM